MLISIEKAKDILRPVSAQVLLVFAVFAVMVITSYFFMSQIERKHLIRNANNAISNAQTHIEAELLESETTLGVIAETIRNMILAGFNSDSVHEYIKHTNTYMWSGFDDLLIGVIGCYGIFDVFDGKLLLGSDDWTLPEDYNPIHRPWYTAAVDAAGSIGITQPYINAYSNEVSISFSRQIFDDEGNPLGIVCLDIKLDRIRGHAINTYVTKDSYGILLDRKFRVIAHPHPAYLGRTMYGMNDGKAIADILRQGKEISERKATDYKGNQSVLFVRQINNGWYMGILAYTKDYYESLSYIGLILGLLGLGMAIVLNFILIHMAAAKNKADIESRQKSSFLATVSHEIRTPMNAILGIAEIQTQNKNLPHDTHEALQKIYNSGYTLLGIINDVLDLSKIEAGKLELQLIKYDVASMINDTVQLNIMRIGSKPIKFNLEIDPLIPVELIGDELRIKQILNNLLSNAFKYTEHGEVVLSISAKLEDRVKAPYVLLIFRVNDTGQGMSAEQVRKLFDEYSRFNIESNRLIEGTGLGMSITKHLVELMKGSISVTSKPDKGSTFTVSLPQGFTSTDTIGTELAESLQRFRFSSVPQMKAAQIVREPMPYGKVLVVDDVETNLYVAKGLLSPYELSIDTAESGFETIEKIKAGNVYDIVFMDHMMPEMDGIEAAKIIRELGYTHPVVALTANAVMGQAEMFLSKGFDDFISKPIDIRQLNALLNKLIRDKQSPEVIETAHKNSRNKSAAAASHPFIAPELADVFIRDAQKTIKTLETIFEKHGAFDSDDMQLYVVNTHAIKSALANIGETALSDSAQKLEMAGREQNIAVILAKTPAFLDDLQAVIRKITPMEKDGDGKTADDMAFLQEKLLVFRAACVVYDKKAAKETIIELKKKKWSRPIKELLNTITELLLHSEFEEAANMARDYDYDSGS